MESNFTNTPGNCFLPKHFEDDSQCIGYKYNGKHLHGYCSKCKCHPEPRAILDQNFVNAFTHDRKLDSSLYGESFEPACPLGRCSY